MSKENPQGAFAQATGSVTDSPWAHVATHAIIIGYNLLKFAGICALSVWFNTPWALLALLICPWSQYKHDFNKSQNDKPIERPETEGGQK